MTIRTSLPTESGENRRFGENQSSRVMKAAWIIGGSVMAAYGIARRDLPGAAIAAGGGYLAYHGLTHELSRKRYILSIPPLSRATST